MDTKMPIFVTWDNEEKTLIRLDYDEPVLSWAEYDSAVDQSYQLARDVTHPVAIIHNAGKVNMPKSSAFPHLQRAIRLQPENVQRIISVVNNLFARALLPIIIKHSMNHPISFAKSLDEARALVDKDLAR
jgi:hypothetical protein